MNLVNNSYLDKATVLLFALLPLALLSSMAGMELISWSIFLLASLKLWIIAQSQGVRAAIKHLSFGAEIPLWGFFACVVVGAWLFSTTAQEALGITGAVRWVLLLYAYRLLLPGLLNVGRLERYSKRLSIIVFVIGVYALLQFKFGWEFTRSRTTVSPYGDYFRAVGFFNLCLTFAAVMGMWGMLALGVSLQKWRWSWMHLGVVGAIFSVFASLTRGAYLAGALTVVPCLFFIRKTFAAYALVAMTLMLGAAWYLGPTVRERLQTIVQPIDRSSQLRFIIWRTNLEIAKDHPVLGVGLSRNKLYLAEYYKKLGFADVELFSHAHNNVLQILAGTGVVGLFFWLWLCGWFLFAAWRVFKRWGLSHFYGATAYGLLAAQVFFHLSGMTENNFTDGEVNHTLVFFWGLIIALNQQKTQVGEA